MSFDMPTREMVYARAGYRCECQCEKCLNTEQLAVHHRISNTKVNRNLYGERLQSADNAAVLCNYCHANCYWMFKGWRG